MGNYELLKLFIDLLLVPMFGMIWAIQGRISKLEAFVQVLLERRNTPRSGQQKEN